MADEFGLRFLETSAKANEGVEEAFFTLARWVVRSDSDYVGSYFSIALRDISILLVEDGLSSFRTLGGSLNGRTQALYGPSPFLWNP